jgi:cytochrome c-type biogenesis protein CcmH
MLFWTTAAVLTFLATLAVILPLARRENTPDDEIEFDKAIYRARVSEIENDRNLGRISEDAAKLALAEEGRKLITLAENSPVGLAGKTAPLVRYAAGLVLFIIPIASVVLYLAFGNPGMPDQTLASRLNAAPENQSIEELVARTEAHLAENPDDATGWSIIAPVYARLGRYEDAARAWVNVYRIAPETPEIRATLAESLMAVSGGVVTEAARKLFAEELVANQASARARFYLAMALGQEGRHGEAVKAWDELIAGGTSQSPWMAAALNFRNISATEAGLPEMATAPDVAPLPGPDKEDVEAASQMTAEERREMIGTMVAGLAAKLEEDPADKEGWQRLIRSYIVLGKTAEAESALEKAETAHKGDAGFMASLEAFRAMLPSAAGAPDLQEGVTQ